MLTMRTGIQKFKYISCIATNEHAHAISEADIKNLLLHLYSWAVQIAEVRTYSRFPTQMGRDKC